MRSYENGQTTRRIILNTSFRLFLERGYHQTSYDDIRREAHVNRGSIYYHFKEKETIRYEVYREILARDRRFVELHCPGTRNGLLLAMYVKWLQFLADPRLRQFTLDYYRDHPIYSPQSEPGQFYSKVSEYLYGDLLTTEKLSDLAFASAYGHLQALFQLAAEEPERYDAREMIRHCVYTVPAICGIQSGQLDAVWAEAAGEMEQLPPEEALTILDGEFMAEQ